MKIKKAELKHLDAILQIQDKSYEPDMVECPSVFSSIIDAGESFVFVIDDTVIGYALCHYWDNLDRPPKLHEELDIIKQHACFFIHDLAIDPAYRRQGYAEHFIEFVCNIIDIPMTLVSVNNTLTFWSKFGFIPVECDEHILKSFSGQAVYMLLL